MGYGVAMRKQSYTHVSAEERETVSLGLTHGHSHRTMARVLGRAPRTVSREAARHTARGRPLSRLYGAQVQAVSFRIDVACASAREATVHPAHGPRVFVQNPFTMMLDRLFACPVSVVHNLSGSSVRVFHPRAELFVAPRGPRIDDRRDVRPRGRVELDSSGLDQLALRLRELFTITVT